MQVRGVFDQVSVFRAHFIRKFAVRAQAQTLDGLGSLTDQVTQFLDASVRAGLKVFVAFGTQAGHRRRK